METKPKETEKEILDRIYDSEYRSNYKTEYPLQCILKAMRIYSDQQSLPLQSEISRLKAELEISQRVNYECDVCHNHPTIIYSTPKGRFCESCKPNR
jgi:hypothetical protein